MDIKSYKKQLKLCRLNTLLLFDDGYFHVDFSLLELVCIMFDEQINALNLLSEKINELHK